DRPDLAARVHQSFLNTGMATLLAGKTLTDEDFDRDIKTLFGPAAVKPPPDEPERFSVTFAQEMPFQTTFADGQVSIVIRTRGFTSGDTVYEDPYDVTIRYALTQAPERLAQARQEVQGRHREGRPVRRRTSHV